MKQIEPRGRNSAFLLCFLPFFVHNDVVAQGHESRFLGSVVVEKQEYGGWPNCYRISNGVIELVATSDVGPRIIRFGFVGRSNVFGETKNQLGKTGGDEWKAYGGHRLWHAPEDPVRTYEPDNGAVKTEKLGDGIRLIQPVEKRTGIQKEIELRMEANRASVRVLHRLRNLGPSSAELAPWTLTVMERGGVAIFPLPPRGSHPRDLLPTSLISLWAYSDMSDPRWTWGRKYVLLRQDGSATSPQKAGFLSPDRWAAYVRNGILFVKTFGFRNDARYPDFGSNVETFTNAEMIELESLGPMSEIRPGNQVEHAEEWFLAQDVQTPSNDSEVDAFVYPHISTIVRSVE